MKIIDIRIEMRDDLYPFAWNAAHSAAHGIREDLYDPADDDDGFAVEVFDASEEATP